MSPKEVARTDAGGVDNIRALDIEDIKGETEAQLVARGTAYAREYARVAEIPTILLKNIATVVVALRMQYGDMRGETHPYRQAVAEMYRAAGVPPTNSDKMQTAVRWHVGNLLRQRLTPRQLEKHDLLPTSPLERLQDTRAANSALVRAASAYRAVQESMPEPTSEDPEKPKGKKGKSTAVDVPAERAVKATADHIRLVEAARNITAQLSPDVIKSHMTDGQRAKLDEDLAAMQKRLTELRRLTRKRSSDA